MIRTIMYITKVTALGLVVTSVILGERQEKRRRQEKEAIDVEYVIVEG